ncbi:hypothetical protein OKA04_19930 [Luteolibacter flavescens]|uniref:Uncharacterized protein n=1 Tax=Luteolibacter flavescens TaxID=1859460 RepID=A0ABT3FTW3_9BACT|nr:hypothetical protein [Luteolibacter flavescens]MCW1887019.1 hypothetical protein [Luteolibacter flavescens]
MKQHLERLLSGDASAENVELVTLVSLDRLLGRTRGTLQGRKLELAVEEAKPDFGGRLRFRGRILEAPATVKS